MRDPEPAPESPAAEGAPAESPPTLVERLGSDLRLGGDAARPAPVEPVAEGVEPEDRPDDDEVDPDLALVAELQRFRVQGLLGRGGMGRVYRAFDMKLERPVALKLLALENAEATRRFLEEARAQARIDHPNVCKIFDTGEIRGRRFIVMQLLEGRSLAAAARKLPLERKVALVKSVCDGVQAAHRIGLVHRDLKTSNVLVVAGEEGLHPFVVDFGLVRDVARPGQTMVGLTVGTPWYMAPEQVAGGAVDRRADIYSLGVVLYELAAGRYPIEGTSAIEVLSRVLAQEDPIPLRRVAPRIPVDLETVVMKCLERDPERRYESARALADDLGRWLDGEPVEARAAGVGYRLAKRLRKRWPLVALGAAAVVALAVGAGFALSERARAADRARVAQRFGVESERLEWMLRAAYGLPLTDVSAVRAAVAERLRALEGELSRLAPAVAAPALAAIGRGYLALDDEDRALVPIESAWESGDRAPELAYARGLALARRYERAIDEARRLARPAEREAAIAEAARRLGAPARAALALSAGAVGVPSRYLEALLAHLDGDAPRALAEAAAVAKDAPWYYEAALLEAAVRRDGAPPGRDGEELALAERALARAAALGESDPRTHVQRATLAFERMSIAIQSRGEGVEERFAEGVAAVERALVADPSFPAARRARLSGEASFASWELDRGRDAAARLAAAIAAGESLVTDAPSDAAARLALARARAAEAKRLRFGGGDPRPVLAAAVADLEAARRLGADGWRTAAELGQTHSDLAIQAEDRGEDPEPLRDHAIAELERATTLAPDLYSVHFDLARAWSDRAARSLERGVAADGSVDRALASFRRALELKPDYPQAENSLGVVHLNRSWFLADRDLRAARADAEAAIAHFERAQAIQADYANARFNLGLACRSLSEITAREGGDPWPLLDRGLAAFRSGLEINPGIFFAYSEMGRLYTQGAAWNLEHGRSPGEALVEANRLIDRALERAPDDFMTLMMKGEAVWTEARWDRQRGRDARPAMARARDWIERADRANPESLATLLIAARIELDAADDDAGAGRDAAAASGRARGYLARARSSQPDHPALPELDARLAALPASAPAR